MSSTRRSTNPGPVVHPTLVLLNAAAIDAGPFALEVSETTPSVQRLIDAVDGERMAIRAGLGSPSTFRPSSSHDHLPEEVATFEHRYVTEDVALGLSLLESAGRLAAADTPVISGLLSVFGALLGRDLRADGRGLDRLGLGDFVRREIGELLHDGWFSTLWRRVV